MSGHFRRIITLKCPRCGQGDLFVNRNPYAWKDMVKMNNSCPACGQDFRIETGFYQGALYVSYMLGVAFCLPFFALLLFVLQVPFWWSMATTFAIYIATSPYTTRLSRAIWLVVFYNQKNW